MKIFDFDKIIDRRNTNAIKYTRLEEMYGSDDVLSLWIADMDLPCPDEVSDALKERANHPIYGYSEPDDEYWNEIISFFKRRHNLVMDKAHMFYTAGIVPAIDWALLEFTNEGDNVCLMSPVYGPFFNVIKMTNRVPQPTKLIDDNGYFRINFEELEEKLKISKVLLLSSPHNPVGRVWTMEELQRIGDLCEKYDVLILSDEIHCDLILPSYKHIPTINVSENIANRTITFVSPSKTFNIAGLINSTVFSRNDELFNRFKTRALNLSMHMVNAFTIPGTKAAYKYGDEWLDQVMNYIDGNYKYLCDFIKNEIPEITVTKMEGTYLVWLNCKDISKNDKDIAELIENKAKVAGETGGQFGENGEGYYRLNIACSRKVLKEALSRIAKVIRNR